MPDAVGAAQLAVPHELYTRDAAGQRVPQSSAPALIADLLRLLAVQPGMRVLEVGTGSGYSTALLAHLVGPKGAVISLDIDAGLTVRAARLLARDGRRQATVVAGDGRRGYPAGAPFDRLVAWATADAIPMAWVEQLHGGGRLVAPVRLAPLVGLGVAVVRTRVEPAATLVGEAVVPGTFVPLTDIPLTRWTGPDGEADAVLEVDGVASAWASASWMLGAPEQDTSSLLRALAPRPWPLAPGEKAASLWAYLLATQPAGLTTAGTRNVGRAIGYSQPGSMAVLSIGGSSFLTAGTSVAVEVVARWVATWRAQGRPGFARVRPHPELYPDGWRVRLLPPAGGDVRATRRRPA